MSAIWEAAGAGWLVGQELTHPLTASPELLEGRTKQATKCLHQMKNMEEVQGAK